MSVEGALRIELTVEHGAISDVVVTSSRPLQASRVFHGMQADAVLTLVPRLFSVCGTAQACAAVAAVKAARGVTPSPADQRRRCMVTLMETAQEHLWRVCLDGARLAGEAPLLTVAAAGRALLPRMTRALFPQGGWSTRLPMAPEADALIDALEEILAREVFGLPTREWIDALGEPAWWRRQEKGIAARMFRELESQELLSFGKTEPRLLTALDPVALDRRLESPEADAFIAAPTLDGVAWETTPLARRWHDAPLAESVAAHGTGLGTRFTALLLELASLPAELRRLALQDTESPCPTFAPAPGTGLAQVEAARGLLAHRVRLAPDGTVARYQILAPTEWNFHPQGLLARALRGSPANDPATATRGAELLVQAIDPCVGFEVVVHA